jgi:hypothetical protein
MSRVVKTLLILLLVFVMILVNMCNTYKLHERKPKLKDSTKIKAVIILD